MLKKCFNENFISIILILILLKVYFVFTNFDFCFEYIVYGLIVCLSFLNKESFNSKNSKSIIKIYALFVICQLIGLLQVCTFFSLRNIISAFIVFNFLILLLNSKFKINFELSMMLYYAVTIVLLIMTFDKVWLKNTIPAIFLFLSCIISIINLFYFKETYNKIYVLGIFVAGMLSAYISYQHHSRTALFSLFIIIICFFIFNIFKVGYRKLNVLFYILIFCGLLTTYFYINIKEIYFYEFFDSISYNLFGKFLDSSRPFLWSESLKILSGWQYFIGAGTGKLPEIARFENSSFHNTYLQLFIQNGILGLIALIAVFKKLWNLIISNEIDEMSYLVISIFIGVIIYNCFETTLLQNKTFLGIVEWLTISIGYQCIVFHKDNNINEK